MPVPGKLVETRRPYQHIADQIRVLIHSGNFPSGSRLPPERDLAQQLGISRPSLREALIALEIEGSVEIRMGSGIYVCTPPERVVHATAALGESPAELMEARAVLEGAVVIAACARVTAEGLARLAENLEAMRGEIEQGRSPLEFDRRFHLCIAEMSGNSVLVRMINVLFDERHSPISSKLSGRFETSRTWAIALKEHEAIYQALENRDPLLAQAAIHSHLKSSSKRWVGA